MKKITKYSITRFYVGELYLYKQFGNLLSEEKIQEGNDKIQAISKSGAINFQRNQITRYIDWENRREYTGFLTIFYKQGKQYVCLHDGKIYTLNNSNIIDNLVMLKDLLPKLDTKSIQKISMYEALELFNMLFKEETFKKQLYNGRKQKISDFYVGDIALRERTPIITSDSRCKYIDLPQHLMLEKSKLSLYRYGKSNYVNTVYRCLFFKDGVDLYNINNHQFYNNNEDQIENITTFKEYMEDFEIKTPSETITIPKALRLFKKTI